jgi:hypothetical protein
VLWRGSLSRPSFRRPRLTAAQGPGRAAGHPGPHSVRNRCTVAKSGEQKSLGTGAYMLEATFELQTLATSVDDTVQLVSSEVWMASLAYYQSVREATHRNRAGARDVYDDLRRRFPGVRASKATPGPATA